MRLFFWGLLLCASYSFSSEKDVWIYPNSGQFALAHKIYLAWPQRTFEQKILREVYLSYALYKTGQHKEAMQLFDCIDFFLQENLESENSHN